MREDIAVNTFTYFCNL